MSVRLPIIVLTVMISAHLSAGELKVKHGLWTASVEVTGLPVPLPPHTFSYCVDKDSAIPQEKQMQGCTMNMVQQANSVNWKMTCDNGSKGVGTATYQWDTMQAQVELTLPESNMSLTSKMTGKWSAVSCSR